MSEKISVILDENRLFPPAPQFVEQANVSGEEEYQKMYRESIDDPEAFWSKIADTLVWDKKWDRVLNWENKPFAKWFEGAKLNITNNCIDRHLKNGKKETRLLFIGKVSRAIPKLILMSSFIKRFVELPMGLKSWV